MKVLLDEMFDPRIAQQLNRYRGLGARDIGGLRGMPDPAVFAYAQTLEHVLVTENVADFIPLANQILASGKGHHGLILTSNASFPRARPSTTGAIVKSIAKLNRDGVDLRNQIVWLQP